MHYDVIIIGAGPAGSATAIKTTANGQRVLLVDWQEFPRDKVCGDGIAPGTARALKQLGLTRKKRLSLLRNA